MWIRAAAAAVVMSTIAAGAAAGQTADVSAEILAKERALAEAVHARNQAQIEDLLGSDYVLRSNPDVGRDAWIRDALGRCWGDRSDIERFRAVTRGETIVASFLLTLYIDPSNCRPAVLQSLITDVWIREADTWRLQLRHAGPPPAPDSAIAFQFRTIAQPPPPTWDISGELSLVATAGNTSTQTLGLGTTVIHRSNRSTTRATIAFVRSEAEDVTQARSLATQLRHGVRVAQAFEVFGQASYAHDRFAGIDGRTALEGGVSHTASLPLRQALTTEGSVGFTVERRVGPGDLEFATAAGALRYTWTIRPGTVFGDDVAVIADLEAAGNWRAVNAASLSVALTQLMSLKASHAYEYRNTPVAGFGRVDVRTAAALVFSWQRSTGP